jgi:glycosyltransferase involved in cell wall biosynthesis
MARLAWFSPLPPAPTGIADYSADVLRLLCSVHRVDAFHAQERVLESALPAACQAHPAEAFAERHARRPYDLAIYQMGNGPAHDFLYDWLPRQPGLLVLHDLVLHHARARAFLDSPEALAYRHEPSSQERRQAALLPLQRYREELAYNYPRQAGRLASAQLETAGRLLPYAYPLFRLPVEASRATAAHNGFMLRAIREELPEAALARVAMPMARALVGADAAARIRARHGIAADELVVGSFGLLTPEKRIDTLSRAAARARALGTKLRLLLVGPLPDAAAHWTRLGELGLRDAAILTGRVPLDELPLYIEACDVVVHLRYPSARETSAALLRVLAQGRATVISDLEHLDEIPSEAVLRADPSDEEGGVLRAILTLGQSRGERERLGRRAAEFTARAHSPERCLATYEAAIESALRSPAREPRAAWPAHWRVSKSTAERPSAT